MKPRPLLAVLPPQPSRQRHQFFHWSCHEEGPLHQEWAAACYERMAAQRDFHSIPRGELWSWDDPYVKAAIRVEQEAITAILRRGYRGNLTYQQRTAL